VPTPWQRDLETDRLRLTEWIGGRLPDARELRISDLRAPQSSGFSSDTLLFELEYRQDGDAHREPLVVRIQPTGFQVFPDYDMSLQFRTLELLAATDVPVPKVYWLECDDRDVLGADFFVMGQIDGRVPTDNPPYHQGGWMTEISAAERKAIWLGGFECMAKIHRLDCEALGFGFLDNPELGDTPLDQHITNYKRYLEWAARGREQPTVEAALQWIEKNKPDDRRTVLAWGDARIGNIIFRGTQPAAVLDWEMVGLGSPEQDVAWQIFLDRHHSEGIGTPRLAGFPGYDETLAHYSDRSGFAVEHLHFYQVFAGFRFGVIMIRLAQQMGEYGVMDADTSHAFEINNTVTRLLASLLDLPAPGAGGTDFSS
jgi:aminoglycoside phosphotransferase (APT) family kinase protein